ncbi:UDP-N-acetylmuramoyl-tripeptide--D-alanyl-D-alanine ligase [Candidatus Kaiserbacteria bacterium]|nr:UDP-N-acetylmuramoyl-tripeptide--D-alanyl-D-alanine ligase [Candidatus Kaiserbacteria bacterium]
MKELFKKIVIAILTFEAKLLIRRTKPKIVAITGSVGKTSVKDAVYQVLKDHTHTRKSEKSFNSEIGVPLSVLGLRNAWHSPVRWFKNILDGALLILHPGAYPKVLVLEVGVDRPGDMDVLTSWIKPDVVVLTRLPEVPVHVEFFDSPEAVRQEKRKLVEALVPDGVFVYNHDDERVCAVAEGTPQQRIGYGVGEGADCRAEKEAITYEGGRPTGYTFTLTQGGASANCVVQESLGGQHAYNYAAAVAVGSVFGVAITDAAQALSENCTPPGRMRLLRGNKDTTIIDDTYNASPVAVERSLQSLKEVKGVKRRIAVLGDMMELGQYSIAEHERIGGVAASCVDVLVTIGVRARGIASGARAKGLSEKNVVQFDDANSAGRALLQMLEAGDIVLVKGSQSIRAERTVEILMAEPERATELLVRQGTAWKG